MISLATLLKAIQKRGPIWLPRVCNRQPSWTAPGSTGWRPRQHRMSVSLEMRIKESRQETPCKLASRSCSGLCSIGRICRTAAAKSKRVRNTPSGSPDLMRRLKTSSSLWPEASWRNNASDRLWPTPLNSRHSSTNGVVCSLSLVRSHKER